MERDAINQIFSERLDAIEHDLSEVHDEASLQEALREVASDNIQLMAKCFNYGSGDDVAAALTIVDKFQQLVADNVGKPWDEFMAGLIHDMREEVAGPQLEIH